MPSPRSRCWLLTLAILLVASRASADEVHVMVSGAFTAAYKLLVADWERSTGHSVTTVYGASMGATASAIPNRLARGEPADIVILARAALDTLAKNGTVISGSQTDLARSRIAMAVRAGARVPDISTEGRFRQVVLQARSIAYSDSASGVYISTEMFQKLGITRQVAGKAKKIEGTPVGEVVAKGDAEIGFSSSVSSYPFTGSRSSVPFPRRCSGSRHSPEGSRPHHRRAPSRGSCCRISRRRKPRKRFVRPGSIRLLQRCRRRPARGRRRMEHL